MLPSSFVMWDVAPESITQPPCWYRLFKAAIRPALSHASAAEEDGIDWKTGAAVVV
jgi:hypothetical protein